MTICFGIIIKEESEKRIVYLYNIFLFIYTKELDNFHLIRMIEKSVYSKRKIWVTDSEERELIISFFVVKYSSVQCAERFFVGSAE